MAPPAFVSIGYTVNIGQKDAATVINTMSQALDQNVLTFMSPIPGVSEWRVLNDTTILLPDNVTVRRMLTLSTPAALPANGQFPYPTVDTINGCMAALYTGQLEAYCGTPVTELPPVTFDDPATILGASLGSWWTSVQFGSALAGFANPWTSTGFGGLAGAPMPSANPFTLGLANGKLNNVRPAESAGGPQVMATGALAIAQPFSRLVIGVPATAGSVGNWLSGVAAADSDMIRDGANETFTTNAGVNTLVGPPQDGNPHLLGVDANGGQSNYWIDGVLFAFGFAGIGASTGVTALADNTGAAGFLPAAVGDIIQSASGVAFTAAQWSSLFTYAQGRFGIRYGY